MTIKEDAKMEEVEEDIEVSGSSNQRQFPEPFYCPLSHQIMRDPVVDPNGHSFEKEFARENVTYYPNRALKAIIEKVMQEEAEQGSIGGTLRRIDESVRSGWQQLLEKSAFPSEVYKPLPTQYYCPITCEIMDEPSIDKNGNTYEKRAIENWVAVNGTSPITRETLTVSDLRRNYAIQDLLEEKMSHTDASIHPSIRRWKESPRPSSSEEATAPPAVEVQHNVAPNVTPAVQPTTTFPTTQEEIDRRNRAQACTIVALLLFAVVLILFVPYYGIVVLFWCLIVCCKSASSNR